MERPIYFALYELLQMYIYGLETTLTADMELTLTIMATAGSVFVVAVPFVLIYGFFKRWL